MSHLPSSSQVLGVTMITGANIALDLPLPVGSAALAILIVSWVVQRLRSTTATS